MDAAPFQAKVNVEVFPLEVVGFVTHVSPSDLLKSEN